MHEFFAAALATPIPVPTDVSNGVTGGIQGLQDFVTGTLILPLIGLAAVGLSITLGIRYFRKGARVAG